MASLDTGLTAMTDDLLTRFILLAIGAILGYYFSHSSLFITTPIKPLKPDKPTLYVGRHVPLKNSPGTLPQSGPLFDKLSGELRNKIYREVLRWNHSIGITGQGFRRSALLATCKTIREEASTIYYYENSFVIVFQHWHPLAAIRVTRFIRMLGLQMGKMDIRQTFTGPWKWNNMLATMHLYHSGSLNMGVNPNSSCVATIGKIPDTRLVIKSMLKMIFKLRGVDWKVVKNMLENDYKAVLMVVDDGLKQQWSNGGDEPPFTYTRTW